MTKENQEKEVSCPYCESKFRDRIELSKHIDGVHTGLGLLEGNTKRWWSSGKTNKRVHRHDGILFGWWFAKPLIQ
jgi:uncharacterized C2H2 Zn-finger protein